MAAVHPSPAGEKPRGRKSDPKSLIMLTLSMVIYGSIGIFRRNLPFSSPVLACYRGLVGALVLFLAAKLRGKKLFHALSRKAAAGLILSGALMGFNWFLLFDAFNYTSVATATLCYYMQPTIIILLSPLVFHERITARKGLCAFVSVVGMVLVSGVVRDSPPQAGELRGILNGLGAAVLYALVIILNKKLPGIDATDKTVLQLLSAGLVLLPFLFIDPWPEASAWTPGMILLLGIIGLVHTGLAYLLYFGSMDGLPAQTVALFSYLDPITALLLSALFLREPMTVGAIFGAVLILGAALLSEK